MKLLQKYRFMVQSVFIVLTCLSFLISFKFLMMIFLLSSIFLGVFFCGWICPFGTVQDIFSKIGSFFKIRKRKMPTKIHGILKYSRYLVLVLTMVLTADIIFSVMNLNPKNNFDSFLMGNAISYISLSVIIVFALISLFFERPFCNYLCFEGAKYGILSYFRLLRIKRDESSCINCKKCDKACPMNIEISTDLYVSSPQCINCMECLTQCPVNNCISYKPVKQKLGIKSIAPILLIAFTIFFTFFIGKSERGGREEKEQVSSLNTSELNVGAESYNDSTVSFEENYPDDKLIDGEYLGEGIGFRGKMTVSVVVKDSKISQVEVVSHREDRKWFNRANYYIPREIIETQSTDVDVVSGATYSSIGIINAVKDALNG